MSMVTQLSQSWFQWLHGSQLVYNTCWEDPRLDREALQLGPTDTVAMITSAGCNALDYALDAPKRIHCVDLNPRQNALLELKIAAVRSLEFDDFFQVFGKGFHSHFTDLYHEKIRKVLKAEHRSFWDKRAYYFMPRVNRQGLYKRGSTGLLAWGLQQYMSSLRIRGAIMDLFSLTTLAEQREAYEACISRFWRKSLERAIDSDLLMSLLGVPRAQRRYLEASYNGSIAAFVRRCLDEVFTAIPLSDNYFWWLYISGSYSAEICPEYLREENFRRLKGGLVDRIETHTNSVTHFLRTSPDRISRYVLLDHMDWLADHNHEALEEEWDAIHQSSTADAKILFRSGGLDARFLDEVYLGRGFSRTRVSERLHFSPQLAQTLHERDRVRTYGSFHIAQFA